MDEDRMKLVKYLIQIYGEFEYVRTEDQEKIKKRVKDYRENNSHKK